MNPIQQNRLEYYGRWNQVLKRVLPDGCSSELTITTMPPLYATTRYQITRKGTFFDFGSQQNFFDFQNFIAQVPMSSWALRVYHPEVQRVYAFIYTLQAGAYKVSKEENMEAQVYEFGTGKYLGPEQGVEYM